ncbi:MAG: response regulator [Candidatus Sumerlaeaceae bacterium]
MTCRILIVDSDENSRTILTRRLTRRGFEVLTVEDGSMAIAEVTSQRPDVILMDLSVVTMDCWQTARELKRKPETAHVPIVAISVLDLTWDQEAALQAGCDVYLPKPINMDTLGDILVRVSKSKCVSAQPQSVPNS